MFAGGLTLTSQVRAPRKTRSARGVLGRFGVRIVLDRRRSQPVDQVVESFGQGTVPVGSGLLVADSGRGGRVAEAGHDLAHGGALLGGDGAGGVAQIVEVDLGEVELGAGGAPLALEPSIADDAAGLTGEERPIGVAADEGGEVGVDGVEHEPGERDGALAGVGLGGLAAGALVDRFADGEGAVEPVVVADPERSQLAVTEPGEAGDEDHRPDASVGDVPQRQDDLGRDERSLGMRV